MDLFNQQTFALFVLAVALVYAVLSQVIQRKVGNYKRIKEIQDTFKSLNEELNVATKANDKAGVEAVLKKQNEAMPMLMESMTLQFKPLIVILLVFIATTWVLGQLEPYKSDDLMLQLSDDGKGCDAKAGDGIFSACFALNASMPKGAWAINADAMKNGNSVGSNGTALFYDGGKASDIYILPPKGEALEVAVDKPLYAAGDVARITAKPAGNPGADYVAAKLNNGTDFYVDLPFAIPLLNIQRVIGSQGFFLLCVFVLGMLLSFAFQKYFANM